jgi:hypothetical protein
MGVAEDGIVALRVLVDGGVEREAGQFGQLSALHGPKAQLAQLAKMLPRWHALILLQRGVPGLRRAAEVVRGEPCVVRRQGALTMEELLAAVEPVEGVHLAVICRKL